MKAGSYTDLVLAAQSGNKTAFNTLLTIARPELYVFGLKQCSRMVIVEDALQEASIYALGHLHKLRDPSAFFSWMASIVKRAIWKEVAASRRDVPLSIVEPLTDSTIESEIEHRLSTSALYDSIDRLTDTLRLPVLLRYFSSNSDYEQIASILEIPVGTVRSRLNQAKKQLQQLWEGGIDLPEQLRRQSEEWNEFYRFHWNGLYDDLSIRSSFYDHIKPDVLISYTKTASRKGRRLVEREVNDDVRFGTRSILKSITNIGNIGLLEFANVNSVEFPDRCPPGMTIIFDRQESKAAHIRLHLTPFV